MAFDANKPLTVEDVYQDKHVVGIEMSNGVRHRIVKGTYREEDTQDERGMKIRLFVACLSNEEWNNGKPVYVVGESRSVVTVLFVPD